MFRRKLVPRDAQPGFPLRPFRLPPLLPPQISLSHKHNQLLHFPSSPSQLSVYPPTPIQLVEWVQFLPSPVTSIYAVYGPVFYIVAIHGSPAWIRAHIRSPPLHYILWVAVDFSSLTVHSRTPQEISRSLNSIGKNLPARFLSHILGIL
ncbi:uncharacterized protein BO88DRAFT_211212 [Aspergillus vadensis CBS 113365]|uniref:Uncharacterized protein n=1 Tax=Aspergillus vadensis (strain CBS 113365 / IMI 142717 / IBT 24658) TaxID=1448311 RepID=A0A319BHW8_ASPVC|nr:hypothetical protein BO88DRAFT_211212 [Aspergillus vadensis CBS 113365]PYH72335.1 hypothetical protein BO88DRAFT_211212 [Aspergillus vadensis CBS 113365]